MASYQNLSADPVYKVPPVHTAFSIFHIQKRNLFQTFETTMESPKALTSAKFLFLLRSMSLFFLLLMIVSHVIDAPTTSVSVILSPDDRPLQKFVGSKAGQVLCSVAAGEAAYVLALGTASLFSVTATIYSVNAASTAEQHLTLNGLSCRILATWMRLIVTWVYITVVAVSYALSMVLFVYCCATAFEDTVFPIIVLLLVNFSSLYFIVVRIMSSIVEILEEDCSEPDTPLSEEESLLSRIEEGCSNDEQNYDMPNASRGIRCFRFLLILAVCGIASYQLVEFGVKEENGMVKIQTASTIVSTCLFLSVELLIFMVFVVLFWGLKKAEEERSTWEGSLRMFWLPLAMILTLLALDQKRVFSYFDLVK